jgi:hypothetical protein
LRFTYVLRYHLSNHKISNFLPLALNVDARQKMCICVTS